MDLRKFIVVATASVFTAGCSGEENSSDSPDDDTNGGNMDDNGESETNSGDETPEVSLEPPATDADPENLLPEATNGWEQTETGPQPEGEAGVYAVYDRSDGDGYQVAVIRWDSEETARAEVDTFESYNAGTYVVSGNFSFIVYGSGDGQYELLGQSPALTTEYVESSDLIS